MSFSLLQKICGFLKVEIQKVLTMSARHFMSSAYARGQPGAICNATQKKSEQIHLCCCMLFNLSLFLIFSRRSIDEKSKRVELNWNLQLLNTVVNEFSKVHIIISIFRLTA